jgi:hypothetical protein
MTWRSHREILILSLSKDEDFRHGRAGVRPIDRNIALIPGSAVPWLSPDPAAFG